MDEHPQPGQAFMSALVTEHFVLQSARSTTSEAVGRSAVYLTCVSSSPGRLRVLRRRHPPPGAAAGNLAVDTLEEIIAAAERGIQRIRATPHLPFSFLRHRGLSRW